MTYACSPHRIEVAGAGLRDDCEPDEANAALRLLPDCTQWCLTRNPITPQAAALAREAARAQAALLIDDDYVSDIDSERDPYLRRAASNRRCTCAGIRPAPPQVSDFHDRGSLALLGYRWRPTIMDEGGCSPPGTGPRDRDYAIAYRYATAIASSRSAERAGAARSLT
jgi:hypothetical protein